MKRLVLLDSHALLFRAYHAMPGFNGPDGRPTGAVYGFANVLIRVLRELAPTWIVACFDSAGPTFREENFAAYKATRAETPADIIVQEPMVKELLESFGIPHCAVSGFEADDLIATLVAQALQQKSVVSSQKSEEKMVDEIIVVTGDRDLLQLSQPRVKIYLLRQSIKDIQLLDESDVEQLIGLPPAQLLDWKALRGDPSDNIPGVTGIGDKTALELTKRFMTLEKLYEALEVGDPESLSARVMKFLRDGRDMAFKSRELLTVRYDAPVALDLDAASFHHYRRAQALTKLQGFGFKSIGTRLPEDQTGQQGSLF